MSAHIDFYTIGYSALYAQSFNHIALLLKHPFITSLRTSVLALGFISIAFKLKRCAPLNVLSTWLLSLTLMSTVLFSGNVRVRIIDASLSGGTAVQTVDHMPFGFALLLSLGNSLGIGLTFLFDAVLHGVHDPHYHQTGFLMNQRMVASLQDIQISDPLLRHNLQQFIQHCVFYDLLLSEYGVKDILNSTDLMTFFKAHSGVNRGIWLKGTQGKSEFQSCHAAIEQIERSVHSAVPAILSGVGRHLYRFFYRQVQLDFSAHLRAKLGAAFSYLAHLNTAAAETLVQQAIVSNSLYAAIKDQASTLNSATGMLSAIAFEKTQQQRNLSYALMAKMGHAYLPLARPVFECALYYGYVFVAIGLLLPQGGALLRFYLKLIAWIQLWSPIFAVFDAMTNFLSRQATTAQLYADSGVTFSNYRAVAQTNLELASVAGYLSFAATAYIAFYMVSRSEQLAPVIAGLLNQDLISSVHQAAGDSGGFNVQLGNSHLGIGNYHLMQGHQTVTSPHLATTGQTNTLMNGAVQTHHADGSDTLNTQGAVSQLSVRPSLGTQLSKSYHDQMEQRQQATRHYQDHFEKSVHDAREYANQATDFLSAQAQISDQDQRHQVERSQTQVTTDSVHTQQSTQLRDEREGAHQSHGQLNAGLHASALGAHGDLGVGSTVSLAHRKNSTQTQARDQVHEVLDRVETQRARLHDYNQSHQNEMGQRLERNLRSARQDVRHCSAALSNSRSALAALSQQYNFVQQHHQEITTDLTQPFYTYLKKTQHHSDAAIARVAQSDPMQLRDWAKAYLKENFEYINKVIATKKKA